MLNIGDLIYRKPNPNFSHFSLAYTNLYKKVKTRIFGPNPKKFINFACLVQYIVLGGIFFVQIPVILFCWTEGWSSFESFYFAITSLSAVGLGDFTPSFKSEEQLPAGEREIGNHWRIFTVRNTINNIV